jgi:hypothetical protein
MEKVVAAPDGSGERDWTGVLLRSGGIHEELSHHQAELQSAGSEEEEAPSPAIKLADEAGNRTACDRAHIHA